jgi:predicted porin
MKKTLCSAAALMCGLAASAAMAQSSVQVYGIVDSGVARLTNVNAAGDSITKMPSLTSSFPSRVGFRGTEDLGNGLQAFFVLENGLAPWTPAPAAGRPPVRPPGERGPEGRVGHGHAGRQLNMTYISGSRPTCWGRTCSPSAASIPTCRTRAATMRSATWATSTASWWARPTASGATRRPPADRPPPTAPAKWPATAKACRQYTGLVGYETKAWGLNTSYDRMYGNVGAAGGLTSSATPTSAPPSTAMLMLGADQDRRRRGRPRDERRPPAAPNRICTTWA